MKVFSLRIYRTIIYHSCCYSMCIGKNKMTEYIHTDAQICKQLKWLYDKWRKCVVVANTYTKWSSGKHNIIGILVEINTNE